LRRERWKGKKIVEEAFKTTRVIYIKPLASRPLAIFWEINESSGEEKDLEWKIFEALKRVTTIGEGLEKILWGLWRQFSPSASTFVIISDSKEEEYVEKIYIEVEEVEQFVEVEQLTNFSSILVEGGFFDGKADSLDIHVVVPTKAQSKYMMKHKGKEQVEEGNSPTKISWKRITTEMKEI